jgi:predicted nucleotidyltransferase component of viral defense system
MRLPELKHFYLVGGTCLALRYGHRTSVDLDLFSPQPFDNVALIKAIEAQFPGLSYRSDSNPIGVFCFIDQVKIDFVRHEYFKLIDQPVEEDNIRMFANKDIIAMKVFAVLKRASKKDFWDIAELLQHYSPQDFVSFYKEKYPGNQVAISIPYAISYFADAEASDEPVSLKGQTWESVKSFIQKAVREYLS